MDRGMVSEVSVPCSRAEGPTAKTWVVPAGGAGPAVAGPCTHLGACSGPLLYWDGLGLECVQSMQTMGKKKGKKALTEDGRKRKETRRKRVYRQKLKDLEPEPELTHVDARIKVENDDELLDYHEDSRDLTTTNDVVLRMVELAEERARATAGSSAMKDDSSFNGEDCGPDHLAFDQECSTSNEFVEVKSEINEDEPTRSGDVTIKDAQSAFKVVRKFVEAPAARAHKAQRENRDLTSEVKLLKRTGQGLQSQQPALKHEIAQRDQLIKEHGFALADQELADNMSSSSHDTSQQSSESTESGSAINVRSGPILISQQTVCLVEKAIPGSSSIDEKIRKLVDMNKKLRQQVEEAEETLYATRQHHANDQSNAAAMADITNGYRMSEPSTSAYNAIPPQSPNEYRVPKQTLEATNRRVTVADPPPMSICQEATTMLNQIYRTGNKEVNGHSLPPQAGIRTTPYSDRSKREREPILDILLDEPERKAPKPNGQQFENVTLRKPANGIVDLNYGPRRKPSPSKSSPSKFTYKCADGEIIGIPNIGNSCYMACVLQSFFRAALPGRLRQFLGGLEDMSKQKEELIANTFLSGAFLELNNASFDKRRDQMEKLRHVLLQLEPKKFCAEQQHDAHEFVVFFLEKIKEETTKLLVPHPLTDTEDDIVHSLFTFKIRIDLYCKPCNETDERFETGSQMILRPPDTEENQASINELMHAELSNYGGDYTCPKCSTKFEKTRKWFCKYPRYLILMLQRYSFDELTTRPSKIETSVHVNRDLFLLPSLQKKTDTVKEDQNAIETSSPVRISRSRHIRSIENFPHEISAIPGPSGIVEDEDGDVSIIKEKTIEKKTFPYKPVTNQWRKRVCDQLQLDPVPLQENKYADYECAGQTSECRANCAPEVFDEVGSDGNCLFRALAHVITGGNEEQHMELRTQICSFMKSHRTQFLRSFAKTEKEFDLHMQEMEKRRTWGSESELFACATMLQTPISTYFEGRWVPYMPSFPLEDDSTPVIYSSVNRTTIDSYDHAMYLLNQCEHYYPVLSVPRRKYYELKSVVTHIGKSTYGGHYTAFLMAEKNARGRRWVKCNDSTVVPVSETVATNECAKSGYIFFYESSTETINHPNIRRRRRATLKNAPFG